MENSVLVRQRIRMQQERKRKAKIKRIVFVITILVTLVLLSSGLVINAKSEKNAEASKHYKSIEIQKGDTLWSIAGNYKPSSDIKTADYVAELKQMNGLSSDLIHEGCNIVIYY